MPWFAFNSFHYLSLLKDLFIWNAALQIEKRQRSCICLSVWSRPVSGAWSSLWASQILAGAQELGTILGCRPCVLVGNWIKGSSTARAVGLMWDAGVVATTLATDRRPFPRSLLLSTIWSAFPKVQTSAMLPTLLFLHPCFSFLASFSSFSFLFHVITSFCPISSCCLFSLCFLFLHHLTLACFR